MKRRAPVHFDLFEIRHVHEESRTYRYVAHADRFFEAVLTCDVARVEYPGEHFVVWNTGERRIEHDTRSTHRA